MRTIALSVALIFLAVPAAQAHDHVWAAFSQAFKDPNYSFRDDVVTSWGVAWGYSNPMDAREAAIEGCVKHTGRPAACASRVYIGNARCIAIGRIWFGSVDGGSQTHHIVGFGLTTDSAIRDMRAEKWDKEPCRSNCSLHKVYCAEE